MTLSEWLEVNGFFPEEKSKNYYVSPLAGSNRIVVHLTLINSNLCSDKYNNKFMLSHRGEIFYFTENEVKDYIKIHTKTSNGK